MNELIRVIQQLSARGRWLFSLLPSKPRLDPLTNPHQNSFYDYDEDFLDMAGLGERQPSVIQFVPMENHGDNLEDLNTLGIGDDSVVNQLRVLGGARGRDQFNETGETANQILEGFEAVRERPSQSRRANFKESELDKEVEVFWPSNVVKENSPRVSPERRKQRATWLSG